MVRRCDRKRQSILCCAFHDWCGLVTVRSSNVRRTCYCRAQRPLALDSERLLPRTSNGHSSINDNAVLTEIPWPLCINNNTTILRASCTPRPFVIPVFVRSSTFPFLARTCQICLRRRPLHIGSKLGRYLFIVVRVEACLALERTRDSTSGLLVCCWHAWGCSTLIRIMAVLAVQPSSILFC